MNIVSYLSRSRGVRNSARRLHRITGRFGLSHDRMRDAIDQLLAVCSESGTRPTIFVTAILIERYPEFFRKLRDSSAELGVHGYVHTDHAQLDEKEQYEHMERALQNFSKLGLAPTGFRHPYLGHNEATWPAASRLGFTHASNKSVSWDVVTESFPTPAVTAYEKGLALYGTVPRSEKLSLPAYIDGGILDVPASLPDDEAVVDRLGLKGKDAATYFLRMLDQSHAVGEIMTVVVHNERVPMCRGSLGATMRKAREMSPAVWLATMGEINDWWRERERWRIDVQPDGNRQWRVTSDTRATVLVRNADTEPGSEPWYGEWRRLPAESFVVRSDAAPVVVDSEDAPGQGPQVMLGRWPNGARSVLTITSDIDAMSLIDFLRRPLEV